MVGVCVHWLTNSTGVDRVHLTGGAAADDAVYYRADLRAAVPEIQTGCLPSIPGNDIHDFSLVREILNYIVYIRLIIKYVMAAVDADKKLPHSISTIDSIKGQSRSVARLVKS